MKTRKDSGSCLGELADLDVEYTGAKRDKRAKAEIDAIGDRFERPFPDFVHLRFAIAGEIEEMSKNIFADANGKEHHERSLREWTTITYAAFTVGWLVGLIGILLGASEEMPEAG